MERMQRRQQIIADRLKGTGKFIYRNNTRGELTLPKPSLDGKKTVPPKGEWLGDDYFMALVKTHDATLVREVEERKTVSETKLILDQPPTVTSSGQVEHVVTPKQLTETKGSPEQSKETLITEDPVDGVEIIID